MVCTWSEGFGGKLWTRRTLDGLQVDMNYDCTFSQYYDGSVHDSARYATVLSEAGTGTDREPRRRAQHDRVGLPAARVPSCLAAGTFENVVVDEDLKRR